MKFVIRAGGVGTRLWPLSRKNNPKQFLSFFSKKIMVRQAIDRIKPLLKSEADLFVSINEGLVDRLKKEVPELKEKNIIIEPESKNTGPAIGLESSVLGDRFSDKEIVASLTSDDYIREPEAFQELIKVIENFLEGHPDHIVTPGAKAWGVDTGYSFIKAGKNLKQVGEESIFEVEDWVEKPDYTRAKELIATGLYFCHTGMYFWQLGTVSKLFKKFQPKMFQTCQEIVELVKKGDQGEKIKELYSSLEKISIESAISDKADKIAMSVSNRMFWCDLGKWYLIKDLYKANQGDNLVEGEVIPYDTTDCLIMAPKDKLVATLGLDDLVIIDTKDALFICPKERSGEVKKIVETLKEKGLKKYL